MKNKRFQTTFSKLTISFLCFGLLPLLGLSLLFFGRYSGIIRDNLTSSYSTLTGYVADSFSDVIDNVDSAMGDLYDYTDADGDTLADMLTDRHMSASDRAQAVKGVLQDIMAKSEYISSLRLVDTDGTVYSYYYGQKKTLRDESAEYTSMDIFENENMTKMLLVGTMPESLICINSTDYIFSITRNYMDTSTVETTYTTALATLYADVNVSEIEKLIAKVDIDKGNFYVYNLLTESYIYSGSAADYTEGEHPLSDYVSLLDGSSGYQKVDKQWVFYEKIGNMDAYVVLILDHSDIMGAFFQSRLILTLLLCFAGAVLLILYMVFSIRMSEPTRKLKEAMEQVEQGNLDVRVNLRTEDEMAYVADGFNKMAERLTDYINQVYVAQICQKDAELTALKMQIQPHYLYNTLDVIRMTALEQDDEKTAELLESLAKQLRYVIGSQADKVYLQDELDSIREYFALMKVRYEDRISLMMYVKDSDRKLIIPKFLLQPIVENSIRHGLRDKIGRGAVAIRVNRKREYLEIVVMDDGIGMNSAQVQQVMEVLEGDIRSIEQTETVSIGVKNVYDRIKLNCGEKYGFSIQSTPGMGTVITFILPIWEEF